MRCSISTLHVATLVECVSARVANVRMAANFKVVFGELKQSCNTDGRRSEEVVRTR